MKKRLSLISVILLITLGLLTVTALAYGYNFSFPAASRWGISQGWGTPNPTHQAFDYPFLSHTKVVAAKPGTVIGRDFDFGDGEPHPCDFTVGSRGNYLILDHGNDLETWYFHLSRTGNQPAIGTYFRQGEYMALSDDTGCSDRDHLHFATKLNGTNFDPYDSDTHWVSGSPIPAGYRDQNGNVNGPYSFSQNEMFNQWLALEGKPGSPLGDPYGVTCPYSLFIQGYQQHFERGYIEYCVGGNAEYIPYTQTYLPDVQYRYTEGVGFNSEIVVRNNGSNTATVNITIYKIDSSVFDSRTHTSLGANATWTLKVRDVIGDPLMGYQEGTFSGSAIVSASENVSVVVIHHMDEQSQAYQGIPHDDSASGVAAEPIVYIPAYLNDYHDWNSKIYVLNVGEASTGISAQFYSDDGSQPSPGYINDVKPGQRVEFNNLDTGGHGIGSVIVSSDTSQPLAVSVVHDNPTWEMSFESEGLGSGGRNGYVPSVFKNYYQWYTSIEVQEISGTPGNIQIFFYSNSGTSSVTYYLPAWGHKEIYTGNLANLTNGYRGSARVYHTATNGRVAVAVHQLAGNNIETLGYHGFKNGASTIYLP